jgi:hypothetical protein
MSSSRRPDLLNPPGSETIINRKAFRALAIAAHNDAMREVGWEVDDDEDAAHIRQVEVSRAPPSQALNAPQSEAVKEKKADEINPVEAFKQTKAEEAVTGEAAKQNKAEDASHEEVPKHEKPKKAKLAKDRTWRRLKARASQLFGVRNERNNNNMNGGSSEGGGYGAGDGTAAQEKPNRGSKA